MSEESTLRIALDALLQRLPDLAVGEQLLLARELHAVVDREPVVLALADLVVAADVTVREAAVSSLGHCVEDFCVPVLLRLLLTDTTLRAPLLKQLEIHYLREHPAFEGYHSGTREWNLAQAKPEAEDHRFVSPMLPLLDDADASFRYALVRALRRMADPRLPTVLRGVVEDPDASVSEAALWGLARRGEREVYAQLLALAPAIDPDSGSRYQRNQHFSDIGQVFWWDFDTLIQRYRQTDNENDQLDHRRIVAAAAGQLVTDPLSFDPLVLALAEGDDPFLRETMTGLLERRQSRAESAAETGREPSMALWTVAVSLLATAFMGLVLFSWAFRLLKLKYLLRTLPVSPIRSLAHGLVAVRGRLQSLDPDLPLYPSTEEPCVYYPGVHRDRPGYSMLLVDDSGEVFVDAAGAVLLSEKRLLLLGDEVHLLGTLMTRQGLDADGEVHTWRVIGKAGLRRSAYDRLMQLLIAGVLGANARSGQSRMLFSDPRDRFWIWDNPQQPPLSRGWDVAAIIGVVLLVGVWMTLFAVAGLSFLERAQNLA